MTLRDLPSPADRPPGLLWIFAGDASGTERIGMADLPAALQEKAWVWIGVDLIDQRVAGWLRPIGDLGDAGSAIAAGLDAAPSLDYEEGRLHGVFVDFSEDFLRVSDSIGGFAFSVDGRLLVTGWRHPLAGVDAARRSIVGGLRHTSPHGVLDTIVAGFCRVSQQRIRMAEADLDAVEDQLLAAKPSDERMALKRVRRLALAMHRPVAAMSRLLREAAGEAGLPTGAAATIEDMAGRLDLLDQSVRGLSDRARLLQEEIAAELADESNRSLRTLTVMTALMLPGTLVVGFFGMNTGGLPFEASGWGTASAALVWGISTLIFYRILVRLGAL